LKPSTLNNRILLRQSLKLPARKKIGKIVSGRYLPGKKPVSWDDRMEGTDVCLDSEGLEIELYSTGDQCTPAPGWELLLTSRNEDGRYSWTLYGISGSNNN
jgi:hypothetical protein